MDAFEFSTDWKVARGFYDLVEANLCYDDYIEDESGEVTRVRQRCSFGLDLFLLRGKFLGCVYCKVSGKIGGLYCLTEKGGKGYVDSGYVAHAQRRKGIGFKLLQQACDKLIDMGKMPVCFIVRSKAMDRLIDKLAYPPGTIRKVNVCYDDMLDDLEDFLFSDDEQPPDRSRK
jgi:GNAT superfamily N-acetyltransferase